MYAVIRTGGKQYKVAKNDVIKIEKVAGAAGATVSFDDVLMVGDGGNTTVGTPQVDGASVTAVVLEQGRDDKIIVFKKKRRHNYRRTRGHQQPITVLRVTDIAVGTKKAAPARRARKKAADEPESAPAATTAGQAETTAATEAKAPEPNATKPARKPRSRAKKTEDTDATPKADAAPEHGDGDTK